MTAANGALILAAGQSRRMGDIHKLLAPLGGRPLIAHSIEHILAAGFVRPIVVLGARAEEMRAAVRPYDVETVDAADYARGMAHSLRAGLAAVPHHWAHLLICLGDMAHVATATYEALRLHPASATQVVVPHYQGQRGNPMRWGRHYFAQLAAVTGDVGGRAILDGADVVAWPCDDPGILQDIDTPEALAQARAAYASSSPKTLPRNT